MIATIATKELRALFGSPLAWITLGVLQGVLAWLFINQVDAFAGLQAQLALLANPPGVTEMVAAPLFGAVATLLLLVTPVLAMRLIAEERRNQTWLLLATSPLSSTQIVFGKFVGLLALLSLVILAAVAMMALLALGTRADVGLILCNLLGLWLLAASYAALGLYFSAISRQPVVAAFTALAVSVALWLLDMAGGLLRALSPNTHFQNLNSGLLSSADIFYFVLFCTFFLLLTIHHLRRERGGH